MLNRVETHPYNRQKEAMGWMSKYGLRAETWAPLGEGRGGLLSDPLPVGIGEKHGKTPAQVVLRWHIQRGVIAIPKSVHKERMEENFNIFDVALGAADMEAIAQRDLTPTATPRRSNGSRA